MTLRSLIRVSMSIGLTVGLLGLAVPVMAAITVGGNPDASVGSAVNDDLFSAGQSVSVTAPVHGELFAAGQTVTISQRPDRSLFVAGQTVGVPNGAGYNAFVGGQTVTLAGEYGHDVYAAGTNVVLDSTAHVHGSVYLLGSTLTLHGTIDGQLHVSGQTVSSDAVIGQGATIEGGALSFSGGSIGGDLRYTTSKLATGLDRVSVKGTTKHVAVSRTSSGQANWGTVSLAAVASEMVMVFLSLLVVGSLVVALLPNRMHATITEATSAWGRSMLTGLVVLIVGPIAIGTVLATVIGWPVALILGGLYGAALVASTVIAPIALGSLLMKSEKDVRPWRALFAGAAIIAVTGSLPVVGWLPHLVIFIGLTLPLFGVGVRWVWGTLRS